MTTFKKVKTSSIFRNSLAVIILSLSVSFAYAQDADADFSGSWKTNQGPLVQITKSGDTFKGVNLEHDKLVLENLKFEDGEWTGTLIKPKDGSKYKCTATLEGKKLMLKVKSGLMSKTITWTKQ